MAMSIGVWKSLVGAECRLPGRYTIQRSLGRSAAEGQGGGKGGDGVAIGCSIQ